MIRLFSPKAVPAEIVPSPCVGICSLDADKVCIGCGRSLDEIAAWAAAPPSEKRRIAGEASRRLAGLQKSVASEA